MRIRMKEVVILLSIAVVAQFVLAGLEVAKLPVAAIVFGALGIIGAVLLVIKPKNTPKEATLVFLGLALVGFVTFASVVWGGNPLGL